jgi:hypothetical protein
MEEFQHSFCGRAVPGCSRSHTACLQGEESLLIELGQGIGQDTPLPTVIGWLAGYYSLA